jgi:hypothetical protein
VLDYNRFCTLVSQSDAIIHTFVTNLGLTQTSALEKAQLFFSGKNCCCSSYRIAGGLFIKLVYAFNPQEVPKWSRELLGLQG